MDNETLFKFKYNVSLSDFLNFYMISFNHNMKKTFFKNRMIGIVEMLLGLGLALFFTIGTTNVNYFFAVIGVVFFIFGVNLVFIYKAMFTRMFKKNITKNYDVSGYKDIEIILSVDEHYINETAVDQTNEFLWAESNGAYIIDEYVLLRVEENKGILVPLSVVEEKEKFVNMVIEACNRFDKEYVDIQTKDIQKV